MIPQEKIEEVRERASIVQVISEYLPLKKQGGNYVGLCPFHSEKTPSFSVNEDKKIFHCFGCNTSGNAITFIMKKEGLAFVDAVKTLASRYGVKIDEDKRVVTGPNEALYHINRLAADFFSKELRGVSGKTAREYLRKRGYPEGSAVLDSFSVGYAPDRWDGLTSYLARKGASLEAAARAGLAVKRTGKGYYDRFRGRLIFPIADYKGRIIGFGGRSLGDAMPKYLNSPETAVFKKGETLYGLPQAKKEIQSRGFAIIVEGYFDLLAMHGHGFANSVATMGTALTAAHLRALNGVAQSVYTLFDTDEAGKNAALRALDIFLEAEVPCRIVALSRGKDPDEFLSSSGPGAMQKAIEEAQPLLEFYLKELCKKTPLNSPENKTRFLNESIGCISRVTSVAERGHYAGLVASFLGISPSSVYEALSSLPGRGVADPRGQGQSGYTGTQLKDVIGVRSSNLTELTVLKVILIHPELYDERVDGAIDAFGDAALKDAGRAVVSLLKAGKAPELTAMAEGIKDERIRGWVAGTLVTSGGDGFAESPGKMLEDSLKKILNRGKLKGTTEEMIRKLEESGMKDVADKMRKRLAKGTEPK